MCWIASLPVGVDLTEKEFKSARYINNDGTGFAYAKNGRLFIQKGFMSFDEFYEEYKKVGIDVPRVVHHRLGSGGGKNAQNCHPFTINKNLCVAHNGTLSGHNSTATQSDTSIFTEKILQPLIGEDYLMIQKPYIKFLIGEAIGSGNKFVFLDKDGTATIINAKQGFWDKTNNGAWYSSMGHTYDRDWSGRSYNCGWSSHTPARESVVSNIKNNSNETYQEWLMRVYKEYTESQKDKNDTSKKTDIQLLLQ